MIKVVCMFKLAPGTDEEEFDNYFVNKHVFDAKKLINLRKYTIAKVINTDNDINSFYRINELYYDSIEDATVSFDTDLAKTATKELLEKVIDFTCIFCEEAEVKI
jgi:conserved hypothetical protein